VEDLVRPDAVRLRDSRHACANPQRFLDDPPPLQLRPMPPLVDCLLHSHTLSMAAIGLSRQDVLHRTLWRELDPVAKNRGLVSLMRRHRRNLKPDQQVRLQSYLRKHPALAITYGFKQRLCHVLLKKHRTRQQCVPLVRRLLHSIRHLRTSGLAHMVTLGETLDSWKAEIATMWRFTKSNGITEGFHNKMETISRQAYGFRNFENYRMRVKVLCG
jgi:transposase